MSMKMYAFLLLNNNIFLDYNNIVNIFENYIDYVRLIMLVKYGPFYGCKFSEFYS